MPKMGDAMEEGTLIAWRKNDGDQVKVGDIIAEIETDKSNVEIEAEDAGVLHTQASAGDVVPVGNIIAVIGGANGASTATAPKPTPPTTPAPPVEAKPVAKAAETQAPKIETSTWKPSKPAVAAESADRVKASPLARSVAKLRGVDISKVQGTGPNGRIIESDVIEFSESVKAPKAASTQTAPSSSGDGEYIEPSAIRKVVAKRMVESKSTIPHFYLTIEVDVEELTALREKLNAYDTSLPKVSINDMIVKAAAGAISRVTDVNAAYRDGKIFRPSGIHVGIAVALDEGLIVPVVRDADKLSLRNLAKTGRELIERARNKKLQPSEYSGGTFTVSNMGSFDVENFTAIIDPAQGAILAVSTALKKPVVVDDQIVIRLRMSLTLSADHRVMDGSTGAKFMQELKRRLQNPLSLLE